MDAEEVRREIQRLEGIASPPASLDRILELASDCESDIDELRRAIEADPAVTAHVLRLSNSAWFGAGGQVETVGRAIMVVGYQNVMSLAVCASVAPVFEDDAPGLDRPALWMHSCATAEAARLVAPRASVDPSGAYVAGLLHDLGVVALAQVLRDRYASVLSCARQRAEALVDAERRLLGYDHGWAAAALFERWDLPAALVAGAAAHHAPEREAGGYAAVVAVADQAAACAGFPGASGAAGSGLPPEPVCKSLGLDERGYERLLEDLEERRGAIDLLAGTGGGT